MFNLAMYSASICLETMQRRAASLKCLALNLNVVIHTSNYYRTTCMHGKIIIEQRLLHFS